MSVLLLFIFSCGFSILLKIKQVFGSWWAVLRQGFYSFLYQTTGTGRVAAGTYKKAFTQNCVPVKHDVWGSFPEICLNTSWIPLLWGWSTKWFPKGKQKVGYLIECRWGESGKWSDYPISFIVPCCSVTVFLKLLQSILMCKWLTLAGINWVILRSTWKYGCLAGNLYNSLI